MIPQLVLTEPSAQQSLLPSSEMQGYNHLILWTLKEITRNTWALHNGSPILSTDDKGVHWSWTDENKNFLEDTRNPQNLYIPTFRRLSASDCIEDEWKMGTNCTCTRASSASPWQLSFLQGFLKLSKLSISVELFCLIFSNGVLWIYSLLIFIVILGLSCYTKLQ